jgi:regulatory protein
VPMVTGLAPDPRRASYCVVDVDRGRFASLPAEVVTELRLIIGRELSRADLQRLQAAADEEAAARAALRALARRPHARGDLRRRLVLKQHPPDAVDRALERLAAQGLLDDRQYAEHFAATRAARGRGPSRLLTDLLRQGVDRRSAEAAVRAALSAEGIDPGRAVLAVAARRAAQLGDLPAAVKRRRLRAYLARRGYAGHQAWAVVEQVVALYSSG